MKALIITADHFEDSELSVPLTRLRQEGIEVVIASFRAGPIRGKHGYEAHAGLGFEQVDPDDYDLLILPGGRAPAILRKEPAVLSIAKSFFDKNKPVAAICHGPQILISAGLMKGRRATCYRSVAEEMAKAGALYLDREVVVDGNLVTSRQPSDLPAFMREVIAMLHSPGKSVRV
ncbi:MAG TPA: type 1 glutamine amidotransferase domain-containing protein [Terriglobales bacterium]|nr:type 1 glutamine amidotransferase domain-containing protein [Terriglobales bacterium]